MKLLKVIGLLVFGFTTSLSLSQNQETLSEINEQVWKPFTTAYETLDANLFASIHSKDLVRVSGNNKLVSNFESYISRFKSHWENLDRKQTISFRFFERINSEDKASETGVYKLTINPGTKDEISYYGKFHVILVKKETVWKILVDYDANLNNSIDESTYQAAYAIDDFSKY
ncbi:MAG TPA: hypothetical protein VKZ97_03180 [Flavobacteriaceae bacterium]|nr:hypothetical protein [Flavobacteriaceae bacterium]